VVRCRKCFFNVLLISEGEPSGDGGAVSFLAGLTLMPAEEGEETKFWSDKAIVGLALFVDDPDDTLPIGGIRPPENLDVVERRDAREPGRNGDCGPKACSGLATIGSWGEEGGGGEEVGDGVRLDVGNGTSGVGVSGDAWANNLDKEDGRALGEEFDLVREAKRCDGDAGAT